MPEEEELDPECDPEPELDLGFSIPVPDQVQILDQFGRPFPRPRWGFGRYLNAE